MQKNVASQKLAVYAWNTLNNSPETGDAGNITAQISKEVGATAPTNDAAPTELDATDAPGVYYFNLLQAETNADLIIVSPVSSTAGVTLEPVIIYTTPAGFPDDVMVGTDGANTTVPDAATTAAGLHATTDGLINGISDPTAAAIADAVLKELIADHSGTSGSLAEFIELIKDIAEADTVIDTSDDTQWVLIFNKKGTSTEIMRKNMLDINGAAVTATSAVVGANEHTT